MAGKNDRASVGTYIVTYCSKCDNNVNHVVVAQDAGGIVARVRCIICGSDHKYKKNNRILRNENKRIISPVKSAGSQSHIRLWNESRENAINKVPVDYKTDQTYEKNMLILHSKLGEGVIIKSLDNKIEVIFKDGIRLLVHGINR